MAVFHLTAALALPDNSGEVPTRFVYMPEGTHEIQASVNGKPSKRTITVGPEALAPLQAALTQRLSKKTKPHGAFDHKAGRASLHPSAFSYEAGKGVMLEVEWTKAGREAIEGKDYLYFSPSFMASKTGEVLGLPAHGEIGSLVNDPAFEEIGAIAASHATMELVEELVSAKLLTQEQADKGEGIAAIIKANLEASTKTAVDTAVAEATKDAPEKSALEKEVEQLKEANKTLSESLSAKREADADAAIADAVQAGRIPAKDEETKSYWRDQLTNEATADKAKKELAKLPGAEALKAGRTVAKEGETELKGLARVQAAFARN